MNAEVSVAPPAARAEQVGETAEGTRSTELKWTRRLALGTTALAFGAIGPVIAALALAKPWLVGLAAVPLLAVATEIAAARPPRLHIDSSVSTRRVTEGDPVVVSIDLTADVTGLLVVRTARSGGIDGDASQHGLELVAGQPVHLDLEYVAARWGRGHVGLDRVEWRTPLGLITWQARIDRVETVWVHPTPVHLRSALGVSRTTQRSGPHRSTARGTGVEYHSSRPFETGDRWRDLDHRLLARTGEAWTKTRHADRSRDLMVVVDLIDDGSDPATGPALADLSLRAAEAVSTRHLADKDRVGVVVMGRQVMYVPPGEGRRQGHVIIDRLMRAEGREPARLVMRRVDLRKRVPAGATVLVVSPLFDGEIVNQIHALRRHGRDVAVLHVGHDLIQSRRHELSDTDKWAADLHRLRTEALLLRLRADRIPVQPWGLADEPGPKIEELQLLHSVMVRRSR